MGDNHVRSSQWQLMYYVGREWRTLGLEKGFWLSRKFGAWLGGQITGHQENMWLGSLKSAWVPDRWTFRKFSRKLCWWDRRLETVFRCGGYRDQRDSRFSRILEIFFSFSLLVLDLEPFHFHFHFSKNSEGILFFTFHFSKKVKAIRISLLFLEKKE